MPALTSDPTVTGATLVALAASRSPGGGFAVAADVRRFAGWEFYRVATLRCEVPGGASVQQLAHASGLSAEQIKGRSPAAVAMAFVDAHLAQPPYLLAAHQAGPLASLIANCAQQCPALAAARLLDTAELARQLRGTPAQVGLEAYAEQFRMPRPSLATVAGRAALTAQLFTSLTRQEPAQGTDPAMLLARCAPAVRLELTARAA